MLVLHYVRNEINDGNTIASPSVHDMEYGTKITNAEESSHAASKI